MTEVFLDTYDAIALSSVSDQNHLRAVKSESYLSEVKDTVRHTLAVAKLLIGTQEPLLLRCLT